MVEPLTPLNERRGPVSWRSVCLGALGAAGIAAFTQYNDYAAANTQLINNALPTGLLAYFLVVVVLVVGPLSRLRPNAALTRGEMAVAVAMMLVACGIPSAGLMRWLPGTLLNIWGRATEDPRVAEYMGDLNLPDWPFPSFETDDPARRGNDPLVTQFNARIPGVEENFVDRFLAIPWSAWVMPALSWSLLIVPLLGAVLCLMVIFRRQWVENERLTFPLAGVYLDLIEPPARGHWFNRTLSSRAFWIAFAAVFFIHSVRALHPYAPQLFPLIPLGFDLRSAWAGTWLGSTDPTFFQQNQLYFTVIAITLLIPTKLAFSLWFFFLLTQVERIWYDSFNAIVPQTATKDRTFGGLLLYGLLTLLIARRHLALVARQMFRGRQTGEPGGRYLPYAIAGWGFVLGCVAAMIWLVVAGAGVIPSIVIVVLVVLGFLTTAKVVASTGLLYAFVPIHLDRPWPIAATQLGPMSTAASGKSVFWANMFNGIFAHDMRESVATYGIHALRVTDVEAGKLEAQRRGRLKLIAAIVGALVLSAVLAASSALYVHYHNAFTLDRAHSSPINLFGSMNMGKFFILNPAITYDRGQPEPTNGPAQIGVGAAVVGTTGYMSLRFTNWPFHPIGPLLAYTWGVKRFWASILVGWLIKVTFVKWGGARQFMEMRPLLMGLIIGEAVTAAFWILVSIIRLNLGLDYFAYMVLPG